MPFIVGVLFSVGVVFGTGLVTVEKNNDFLHYNVEIHPEVKDQGVAEYNFNKD